MTRARHAIAVVLVATALCADRSAISAAPVGSAGNEPLAASHASTSSLAARFVNRLTAGLRRAVPGFAIVYQARQDQPAGSTSRAFVAAADQPTPQHQPTSPFQFRLPPPSL
jgi:hypothetical protein